MIVTFYRIIISLLISIYIFSSPSQAMKEDGLENYAILHPRLKVSVDLINTKIPGPDEEKEAFIRNRLHFLERVFNRDASAQKVPIAALERDQLFRSTVTSLLTHEERAFTRMKKRLAYQEDFAPIDHLDDFCKFVYLMDKILPLARTLEHTNRPKLHLYHAPSINSLAKVLAKGKRRIQQGENLGFICDVHGVMTRETSPFPGEKRTRRHGVYTLFRTLYGNRRIQFVAASAYDDGTVVLGDLRDTNLARFFSVRKDNRYYYPPVQMIVHPDDTETITQKKLKLRVHGLVAAARWEDKAKDIFYRDKGFALSTCHISEEFGTVVIADDSAGNLHSGLESLLHSKARQTVKHIYLVLVKPESDPKADKLTPETIEALKGNQ